MSFPRISSLADCYSALDAAPAPPPRTPRSISMPSSSSSSSSSTAAAAASSPSSVPGVGAGNGRRMGGDDGVGVGDPVPPRGMLSVADYADVAVLAELAVCYSILPHLERGILPPPGVRSRSLPRSIAGRVRRSSLGWGCSAKEEEGEEEKRSSASSSSRTNPKLVGSVPDLVPSPPLPSPDSPRGGTGRRRRGRTLLLLLLLLLPLFLLRGASPSEG